LIERSIAYLKSHDKEIIYDAEHFFDGYKDNPDYAIQTLLAAERGGAEVLVLCDTNGGTLTSELERIIIEVKKHVGSAVGIHAHNDSELAVANTLSAVQNGCFHVQGTVNGYGERCGNANLCSVIPNLQLKLGYSCIPRNKLSKLQALSRFVSEVANLSHPANLAYVGKSAFAHKGGVHVSAVMKDARTYEHISPEEVGNERRVLVSDLSGRSNIFFKAKELQLDLEDQEDVVSRIVQELKRREHCGFQYEAAEGSLKLLIKKMINDLENYFRLEGFRVIVERNALGESRSEATIRVNVNGHTEHTASEGNGPVHALDQALRKALLKFYPEIEEMHLSDFKVRVLNEKDGTAAKVRVLIDSSKGGNTWGTVGVSENIIEASWQALMEGVSYYLLERSEKREDARRLKAIKTSEQAVASF
jgi:2-isopropylmalate synthase